jgi:hypothetical protein
VLLSLARHAMHSLTTQICRRTNPGQGGQVIFAEQEHRYARSEDKFSRGASDKELEAAGKGSRQSFLVMMRIASVVMQPGGLFGRMTSQPAAEANCYKLPLDNEILVDII